MVNISQSLACLFLQPSIMTMSDTNQRLRVPQRTRSLRNSAGTFVGCSVGELSVRAAGPWAVTRSNPSWLRLEVYLVTR